MMADMLDCLMDAAVADLLFWRGEFEETRHQDVEDSTRFHLVVERALLVEAEVADERGVVVVGYGVGFGEFEERIDFAKPLNKAEVGVVGVHLCWKIIVVEYARAVFLVLVDVDVIMRKGCAAHVVVLGKCGDEI